MVISNNRYTTDKDYCKVRVRCHYKIKYRGASHAIYNSKYGIPEEVRIVFHNGFNYDFHFFIKQLAKVF